MTLYGLIGRFLRRHRASYAASGAMLAGIAVLTVWIPRQIGRLVDGLVARDLHGALLLRELAWLVAAGVVVYFLRVGWRLKLYAAAYRLGVELRDQVRFVGGVLPDCARRPRLGAGPDVGVVRLNEENVLVLGEDEEAVFLNGRLERRTAFLPIRKQFGDRDGVDHGTRKNVGADLGALFQDADRHLPLLLGS